MKKKNEEPRRDLPAEESDVEQAPSEQAPSQQAPSLEDGDAPRQQEAGQAPPEPTDPIAALEKDRDDLLARLQRLGADYRNYQSRARRDLDRAREFANEELVKSLLPVLDDIERALASAADNHGEDDPLFKGMRIVYDHAFDTLRRAGLT
ncbi:MAG: nucleotide exchange factor GrpE, partial [Planctomycetes bacterium]|nr:nucleotide exchange factor GrpE [Planctomycetota bacterium]